MNARLKLVGTGVLLCLALALTVFCAVQTVQAVQRFEQDHMLAASGDVSTIRPWMTVPFIAHFYHVPESYLDQSLRLSSGGPMRHLSLLALANRAKRPVNSVIYDIQHAILHYRQHKTRTTRARTARSRARASVVYTRAGASPAPTLYDKAPLRSRVGAGLAPALVRSARSRALVYTSPEKGEET